MDLQKALESKSAPEIMKAAKIIAKEKINDYEELLLKALKSIIVKPRSWQKQSQLIRSIGITGGDLSVPYLKELVELDFSATILYRDLGFSICRLNDLLHGNLDFLKSTLHSQNDLLITGACSALLYEKIIPAESDMLQIMDAVVSITTNEGRAYTPRPYIAALAYLWPINVTKPFLECCMKSTCDMLVEISADSLKGKKTKYVLV